MPLCLKVALVGLSINITRRIVNDKDLRLDVLTPANRTVLFILLHP